MKNWPQFGEFLARIEEAKANLKFKEGEECFFRGHSDCQWELLPTLLRHSKRAKLNDLGLRSLEGDLFFEFQARARELHPQVLSDWEILQFMRHHGVATRLLDWTEALGVALYFAVHNKNGTEPCIWLLNPYSLNEHEDSWEMRDLVSPDYLGGSDGWDYSDFMIDFDDLSFGWRHPVALYPVQRSSRLHAQRGYFTIHGDLVQPLDKINPKVVKKVDIPFPIIPDVREFLGIAGINDYSMFPDLDGLARDLHRKSGIDLN
jgi:hypothetical protein